MPKQPEGDKDIDIVQEQHTFKKNQAVNEGLQKSEEDPARELNGRLSHTLSFNSLSRYVHQQKVAYYCLDTIEELEGMSSILQSEKKTGDYWQAFIVAAALLAKKTLDEAKNMRSSLHNRINVFGMSDFESFLQHSDSKMLMNDLETEIP